MILLAQPRGHHVVASLNRVHHIGCGKRVAGERLRTQPNLELALTPALNLDLRYARNPDESGFERVLRQIPKLGLRLSRRCERVPLNRKDRGVHPFGVDPGLRGQVGSHALRLRLHAIEGRLHIRAPVELRRDLC